MNKYAEAIINRILSCSDAKFVTEIYAQFDSMQGEEFTSEVNLMVCVIPGFRNGDLYATLNDLEDNGEFPFDLLISVEPDCVERGRGVILWRKWA